MENVMKKDQSPEWTGDDVNNLARDMGRPLPGDMKRRIMSRIDAAAKKLTDKHSGK